MPTLKIGPVKLALVTTVVALPAEVTIPVKFALVAAITPVKSDPFPEKPVALKTPVLGTKDNFVSAVFRGRLPALEETKVG